MVSTCTPSANSGEDIGGYGEDAIHLFTLNINLPLLAPIGCNFIYNIRVPKIMQLNRPTELGNTGS